MHAGTLLLSVGLVSGPAVSAPGAPSGTTSMAVPSVRSEPLHPQERAPELTAAYVGRIDPWLENRLASGGAEEMLVLLDGPPDLSPAEGLASRADRGRFVYDTLRGAALRSQAPLVSWLKSEGIEPVRFWIVNAVLVRGKLPFAQQLATLPGVVRIVGNPTVRGLMEPDAPVDAFGSPDPFRASVHARTPAGAPSDASLDDHPPAISSVEWGVAAIHANDVWNLRGVRGEGIVIASMDTGVQWTHPALQTRYRGWNDGLPDHSYSWHDAIHHTSAPVFDLSHGTHTTGTMVGDDGSGNQVGVAPGARWVACRNMDGGFGTPATYLECMQWGLAPYPEGADPMTEGRPDLAPDITNNSWTCPPSEGCNALTLQEAFEAIRSAGQLTVAAAGNSGTSGCSSIDAPPADHDSVFAVGAVDSSTTRACFSSLGPIAADGSNRMKPDVAAPGVSVRSSIPPAPPSFASYSSLSGTSMASPHVAGSIALLWSARPDLRHLIRISRCYMEQSAGPVNQPAVCGPGPPPSTCGGTSVSDRPNNLWGWGMINALAAVDLGPDADGDGIADPCDCAPGAGSAFDPPPEVQGDRFTDVETYSWSSLATLAGSGTLYDVARGLLSNLAIVGFASASCVSDHQAGNTFVDSSVPPAGDGFYYLVRGENTCGKGAYGSSSSGTPRSITVCP